MAFDIGSVVAKIDADISGFKRGISEAQSEANGFKSRLESIGSGVADIGKKAQMFTGIVAAGFALLSKNAVDSAASFEQNRIAFEVMLGSADKAKKLLGQISQFAKETPFELDQLVDGSKRLLAYNVEADKLIPTLNTLGNIAAGVGMDKLPNLILAFGQVKAATKLTGMELRQFTEAGVPLLDQLSKALNKPVKEIQAMVSDGAIGFADVEKALGALTTEGGRFFNLMIKQSKTFTGVVSNIKDSVGIMMRSFLGVDVQGNIAEGSIFAKLRDAAAGLMSVLQNLTPQVASFASVLMDKLNAGFSKLMEVLAPFISWIQENQELVLTFLKGLAVGLGALLIIGTITTMITALLNPLTLIVLGIAALYTAWQTNFLGIRDITNQVVTEVLKFFNEYLLPAVQFLVEKVNENWVYLAAITKGAWEMLLGIIQFVWSVVYGLIKVGLALMTGDWKQAWEAIKELVTGAWEGIKKIFDGAIGFIKGWGGMLFNELTRPFREAWDKISEYVNKIKDALDFTKRHSPSVVDIVTMGVKKVNNALDGLNFDTNISPHIGMSQVAPALATPSMNQITISLPGAIIANEMAAQSIAEMIGDNIIKKVQMNVRL